MADKGRIRVFSVDDHPLLSEGIATIINSEPDMLLRLRRILHRRAHEKLIDEGGSPRHGIRPERWRRRPNEALMREAEAGSTADGPSQVRSGLETWFTLPDRPAPMHPAARWKMALVTWAALLPMVIGLAYALAPLRLPFLAEVAASTAIPVVLLTWVVMPFATRLLYGWFYRD